MAARIGNMGGRVVAALNKLSPKDFNSQSDPMLSVLLADPAVACVVSLDSRGRVLAAAPAVIGCKGAVADSKLELPLSVIPGATLTVKYNLTEIERRTTKLQNYAETSLLLGLLLATIASWIVFQRVVTGPVDALLKAIAKSQHSDVPAKVEKIPDNELGEVIQAFNQMQVMLSEERHRISIAQKELYRQSRTDFLTGLPNRLGFEEHLQQRTGKPKTGMYGSALLFIDLDHFKNVNDNFGHEAGDELLRLASERLSNSISRHVVLARLGGDEFAMVLNDLRTESEAVSVGRQLLSVLGEPFHLKSGLARIGASIGIARFDPNQPVACSLELADKAMYLSKKSGRNSVSVYGLNQIIVDSAA